MLHWELNMLGRFPVRLLSRVWMRTRKDPARTLIKIVSCGNLRLDLTYYCEWGTL